MGYCINSMDYSKAIKYRHHRPIIHIQIVKFSMSGSSNSLSRAFNSLYSFLIRCSYSQYWEGNEAESFWGWHESSQNWLEIMLPNSSAGIKWIGLILWLKWRLSVSHSSNLNLLSNETEIRFYNVQISV